MANIRILRGIRTLKNIFNTSYKHYVYRNENILMVCRSEWRNIVSKLDELDEWKEYIAAVVVDDNLACDNSFKKGCFRPSYPYPDT